MKSRIFCSSSLQGQAKGAIGALLLLLSALSLSLWPGAMPSQAAAASSTATSVTFQEQAPVIAAKITLADIAVITPDDETTLALGQMVVAAAPPPGGSKQLRTPSIIAALRNAPQTAGVHWQGSTTVEVRRQGIRVSRAQLQELILGYLEEHRRELPPGEIRFTSLRAPEKLLLPYGELSWKITPSRPRIEDSSSFSIFFKVNGEPAHNCTVRGRVEALSEVVVARESIQRGAIIQAGQLSLVKKNTLKLSHPLFALDQAVGRQAGRTLSAGRPLRADELLLPPVIREGELVKILAGKGALRITTRGIAKADGKQGQVIRVKNISSNKLIYARVMAPGMVSVEF
ncbi:flagellar basal body P-ring formation chaperone FlgA [Desulfogranum mediterraneum]|uniref:flagellar basal body P-ring formation chaperone FlgA n=1 Tax=Desulfogranum mediterraneum TaxID=160661 RepID=UPI001377AA6D|nr:flagellar basal body P-ring formation chaperone FlgA [Desulfogranum mediterraneum]